MNRKISIFALVMIGIFSLQSAKADIIVTILPDSFAPLDGVRSLSVVARTNNSDTLNSLVVDFSLPSSGIFAVPPGTFMQSGMIGFGSAGVSSFDRGLAPFKTASLSLDFAPSQLFPGSDTLLATLNIDTTGIGPGTYNVNIDFIDPQGVTALPIIPGTSGPQGSFTISAVPEPSTLALTGAALAIGFARRRRRVVSA